MVRKNCRLKHISKSQSPDDGRRILFHPLDSNSIVVNHVCPPPNNIVQSTDHCLYSIDKTTGATKGFLGAFLFLFCFGFFVITVFIVLGFFFSLFQMRYHLKCYARDQLTSSNTISFIQLFFFYRNPDVVVSNQNLLFFTELTVCHKFRFHWVSAGALNQKSGYKEFSSPT